jgi:dTDP-4-amino-4,6-dideoxygalactose transaminase
VSIAREFLGRTWLDGDSCRELEAAIERFGVSHAICAARARVAIFLAVRALVSPGRKVVLSPYTISDVINMVICAGAVPVFADVEPETCNVDPSEIERLIDDKTGAVLVTHLHGLSCDMDRIVKICTEANVPLIEDAAQAFGVRFKGRSVASFGKAGIFSFGMYKNVNAFFGGMLVTNDDELAVRIRTEVKAFPPHEIGNYLKEALNGAVTDLATYPPLFKAVTFPIFRFGFLHDVDALNRKVSVDLDPQIKRKLPEDYLRQMTPMQARLALRQLEDVDAHIRAQIRSAEKYHEGLNDLPGVLLPPLRTDFSHSYTYYPIQVDGRHAFLHHLMSERRDVAAQHLKNCADLPCFSEYRRDCPNARAVAQSVVLLPTYPRYTPDEVDKNIRAIRRFFGKS